MINQIAALVLALGLAGCAGSPSAIAQTNPAGPASGTEDARIPPPPPGLVLDALAKSGRKPVTDPELLAILNSDTSDAELATDPEVRAILERVEREGELMQAVAEHVRQNTEICRGYATAIVSRTYFDEPYSDSQAFIVRLVADRGLDCSTSVGSMEMVAKVAELATRVRMLREWGQIVGATQEHAAASNELTRLGLELMRQNQPPASSHRLTECQGTLMGFRCTTY